MNSKGCHGPSRPHPDETRSGFSMERLEPYRLQVDKALETWLPPAGTSPGAIHEAMRYSAMAGGKRVRPVLCLLTAEAFHVNLTLVSPFAVALELVHAYSLIHDDLPCMDNSDFRRGRPSNHKVYGEALAVLAGDALLTEAFRVMVDGGRAVGLPDRVILDGISALSGAASSRGLIGGQTLDLAAEGQDVDLFTLQTIHGGKTGALFKAAILLGALPSDATSDELSALDRFGDLLGQVFQIIDDVLDQIGDFESMGKTPHLDGLHEKATYVKLLGVEGASRAASQKAEEAVSLLEDLPDRETGLLIDLIRFLPTRRA